MNPKKQISLPTNDSFVIAMGNHKYYEAALYAYEQFIINYELIGGEEEGKFLKVPVSVTRVLSIKY